MNTTLTTDMIHMLDHLLAETLRFGNMSLAETKTLTSLGTAHEALFAAGVKIGNTLLLDLYAQHAEHHLSKGINTPKDFNPPAWTPLLAAKGVRRIAEYCQANRS